MVTTLSLCPQSPNSSLNVEHDHLSAKLENEVLLTPSSDDYEQWKKIGEIATAALNEIAATASSQLEAKREAFSQEVFREARRELAMVTPEYLSSHDDRRLQIERNHSTVGTISLVRYSYPIWHAAVSQSQKALQQASATVCLVL